MSSCSIAPICYAGDRFAGTNPRVLGRLARSCEHTYRRLTVEGWLERGVPPQYGCGAAEVVRAVIEQKARRGAITAEHELAGRGDIDRLLTEWRSLLRQVAGAPALAVGALAAPDEMPVNATAREPGSAGPAAGPGRSPAGAAESPVRAWAGVLAVRWDDFRARCRLQLGAVRTDALPELPPLTPEQRRPVNHRFFRTPGMVGR